MRSLLRFVGSLAGDYVAWWWGVGILVGLVVTAAAIAPDAPDLALAIIGILFVPVAIVLLTAFMGTALARERYERQVREHDGEMPDDDGPV